MTGKSHLATGACALAQVYAVNQYLDAHTLPVLSPLWEGAGLSSGLSLISAAAFFLGTLFPDADTKASILGRFLHIPVRHRTWLHAAYLYLGFLALGFFYPIFGWFTFGAFVHLFWDSFSPMGICWFYKILSDYREYPGGARVKKGFHITLYRTGEWTEYAVVFAVIGLSAGLWNLLL